MHEVATKRFRRVMLGIWIIASASIIVELGIKGMLFCVCYSCYLDVDMYAAVCFSLVVRVERYVNFARVSALFLFFPFVSFHCSCAFFLLSIVLDTC